MDSVIRFPAGAPGPRENYMWCSATPRYMRAMYRSNGRGVGTTVVRFLPAMYGRALRRGYYHPTGQCPGHGSVTCDPRFIAHETE